MQFTLPCPCGEKLPVSAAEAASTKRCRCGAEFQIPRLTLLRQLANDGVLELSTAPPSDAPFSAPLPSEPINTRYLSVAQKLQLLANEGELPHETHCLQCSRASQDVLTCYIECEIPYANQPHGWWHATFTALLLIVSPLKGLLYFAATQDQDPIVEGKEVVVKAPLRICADCASRLRRDKRRVRELIGQMKIYQPLFRQYPEAGINIPNV